MKQLGLTDARLMKRTKKTRKERVVPELGNEAIRELSLYSYRILYEIREPDIIVLAVIHKRRDLQLEMIEQ